MNRNFIIRKYIYSMKQSYKSRYMTLVALIAPQKLKKAAVPTTAVVVCVIATIWPIMHERMNWARNTIELTIATSVPMPRFSPEYFDSPVSESSN